MIASEFGSERSNPMDDRGPRDRSRHDLASEVAAAEWLLQDDPPASVTSPRPSVNPAAAAVPGPDEVFEVIESPSTDPATRPGDGVPTERQVQTPRAPKPKGGEDRAGLVPEVL